MVEGRGGKPSFIFSPCLFLANKVDVRSSVKDLVNALLQEAHSDLEKLRAIWIWICYHTGSCGDGSHSCPNNQMCVPFVLLLPVMPLSKAYEPYKKGRGSYRPTEKMCPQHQQGSLLRWLLLLHCAYLLESQSQAQNISLSELSYFN